MDEASSNLVRLSSGIFRSMGMCCRLHESNVPLSEEVVEQLDVDLEPFCYTAGLKFEGSDERAGHWRNFFIGVVGDVDAQEEDNLWPNQVHAALAI